MLSLFPLKKENMQELRETLIEILIRKHFAIYPNWDPKQNPLYDWQGHQDGSTEE